MDWLLIYGYLAIATTVLVLTWNPLAAIVCGLWIFPVKWWLN